MKTHYANLLRDKDREKSGECLYVKNISLLHSRGLAERGQEEKQENEQH